MHDIKVIFLEHVYKTKFHNSKLILFFVFYRFRMWKRCVWLVVLAAFSAVCAVDLDSVTACLVREYNLFAQKPHVTPTGDVLECSGFVKVNSCWGRCDSSEVRTYHLFPNNHAIPAMLKAQITLFTLKTKRSSCKELNKSNELTLVYCSGMRVC